MKNKSQNQTKARAEVEKEEVRKVKNAKLMHFEIELPTASANLLEAKISEIANRYSLTRPQASHVYFSTLIKMEDQKKAIITRV